MNLTQEQFVRNTRDLFGTEGETWLAELPALVARYSQAWNIDIKPPYPGLSYNYVAPAEGVNGEVYVFKAGVPSSDMLHREIMALQLYNGRGIAQLVRADRGAGVLLIERLQPGTQLATLEDDAQATQHAAEVFRALACPAPEPPHPFPTAAEQAAQLDDLRATFDGGTGPYPPHLVERAEALFRDLIASSGPPMLVHGDLHHYNILSAERAPWLAIDPQGIVAEAEYEVGALLRNPILRLPHMLNLDRVMARRVDILADALGFDRQRVAGWGFAQAVLSAWWSYEDHGETGENWLRWAEALLPLV